MAQPELLLFVRFKTPLSMEELTPIMDARMGDFQALAGLTQKYYVKDTQTGEVGGLYVWRSQADMVEYRESELRASIGAAYQTEGEPRIEVLEVLRVLRD